MKFTKQDLLTLLIGLFLFASCKNPDGVGLDVDPGTAIQGTLVTSDVKTQIVEEPAVSTLGLVRYPLGYMKDPIFGETEAGLAMTLYPPQTLTHDFGTSPVLDSAILVLKIDTTSTLTKFYGDTINSKYSIDVYQLTNTVTDYKSSTVQAHNSTLLGNYNGKIFPNTKGKVYNIIAGKPDTLITAPAQIRVPLNRTFIQDNIVSLAASSLTSNAKFADYFKGLYAQVNKTSSTGPGGIAFLKFSGTDSYVQLVYRKTNTTSGIDTVSVNFPLGALASVNSTSVISGIAANIKHNRTGTPVQAQIDAPTASYQVTYLQGLVGLKTKISFPDLVNFTNTYGKAIVNKAELVVELGAGTSSYPFLASQRLSLYRWDIAEQPINISDYTSYANSSTPALFGGYFDSIKNRYIFNVTNYVQTLINKRETDYGTFLAPTSLTEFQVAPTATSAERAIIGAGTSTTNKIKLNIYYTKIN
ncbi:DUF4270 domain-containing protein [Pedobacter endophyticus]|uniref:DUF4270 domain-containing protein n=1 Tax=Pedobacter endophyticus TaxID=2789740 RepID=A0A7U3Q3A1_9SPHI|nr:DUF4270 domain-containing protein [Pedobacter endophyticus]QPH37755.1 DUF4270 domain-containing protein [Pedobacter endophyticus]